MDWVWLLFSFKGRIGRAKYLLVELALLTLWFTLWIVLRAEFSSPWEQWVATIPMIWINLAVTAKRLHDRNRDGWWAVAVFAVNRFSCVFYGLLFGVSFGVDISYFTASFLASLSASIFPSPRNCSLRCSQSPCPWCKRGLSSSCFSWRGPMDLTGSGLIRPAPRSNRPPIRPPNRPAFPIFW